MPAKGKKKLVFDLPPEDHQEFMDKAKAAGLTAIDYFRSMRAPLPQFHHTTRVAEEREKYIVLATFFLELMYKSNGGQRTSRLGAEEEWNSRLDKLEDCIRALRALPIPGTDEDNDQVEFPPNPSWIKTRSEFMRFAMKQPPSTEKE